MDRVETCFEENSEADDVTAATTRCFFGFDRMQPFNVNCTALDGKGNRSNYLNTELYYILTKARDLNDIWAIIVTCY